MASDSTARRAARATSRPDPALVVATFALPHFPASDEHRAWWSTSPRLVPPALGGVVRGRRGAAWRSGRDQPYIAQRRMRALTLATILLRSPSSAPPRGQGLGHRLRRPAARRRERDRLLHALSPPTIVRFLWRRGDQVRMQGAIQRAHERVNVRRSRSDPAADRRRGRRPLAAAARRGRNVVGAHGAEASAESPPPPTLIVPTSQGELLLWATEFAPFFDEEELRLTRTIASSTARDRPRRLWKSAKAGSRSSRRTG